MSISPAVNPIGIYLSMETRVVFDTLNTVDPASITPDHDRGLSLGRVTEEFGTIGLYTRTVDTFEQHGLDKNNLVQLSFQLGLALHADDYRTNGHYTDHLMRVTLHMIEDFGITDPNLIAAGPLHDSFEDHPVISCLRLQVKNRIPVKKRLLLGDKFSLV